MLRLSLGVAAAVARGDHDAAVLAAGVSRILDAGVNIVRFEEAPGGVRADFSYAGGRPVAALPFRQSVEATIGHPLFNRPDWAKGRPHAARMRDHVDLKRFAATDLYDQVHGPTERAGIGRHHAAALLGRSAQITVWMAITSRTDLTDDDMAVLDLLIDGPVIPALAFRFAWDRAVRRVERRARLSGRPVLSARESETLGLVALGWTNARIARHLRISERTVRKHLENVNDKLGTANRVAAVVRWRDLGATVGPDPTSSAARFRKA